MGDLSEHFSADEFRCKCCGDLPCGDNLERLVMMLETVRERYGRPMVIVSGYRCPKHNAEVGGVPNSYHTQCLAADIKCTTGRDRYDLIRAALKSQVRRIGVYPSFIHLDIGETPVDVMWVSL